MRVDGATGRPDYCANEGGQGGDGPTCLVPLSVTGAALASEGFERRENLLVQGDNADVLAALMPTIEGAVDLVYVDPPFNSGVSGSVGVGYANAMDHELWLCMMHERLALLWQALRPGGSLYLHLDENEVHYAKVLLDEIAGRESFVREIIWRIGWISGYKALQRNFARNHDTILYYVKPGGEVTFEKLYLPRPETYQRRTGKPAKTPGYPLEDTWNTSANDPLASIQIVSFSGEKTGFATQKNEALVDRIVLTSSRPGDLVVDAFSGSGTTAAVCHKRGRRYLAIEADPATVDLSARRLIAVVDGSDRRGISVAADWHGGGGFVRAGLGSPGSASAVEVLDTRPRQALLGVPPVK